MNVVHCACGRSYRFQRIPSGHGVVVLEKRWPWSRPAWRPWGKWSSTIQKFRCKCGRNLRP
ncbi:hypothetical protein [Deinococcus yavapaiensis]|uniref:hypothetical protein n=1 Tax=Deinococcus yavapaiensis TaxID=309889 RepID=UPI0011B70419|nr:hypothetical protein [Deinococcus yavapaiensis]